MKGCDRCGFQELDCEGEEAIFILEILIRARPKIKTYCDLFDAARIESYRQSSPDLPAEIKKFKRRPRVSIERNSEQK